MHTYEPFVRHITDQMRAVATDDELLAYARMAVEDAEKMNLNTRSLIRLHATKILRDACNIRGMLALGYIDNVMRTMGYVVN